VRISIITPTLNANRYVAEAVESALVQHGGEFEHIVVDGGSTDGTLDTLQRYPHLRVLVRPALGLYAAVNLGIAEAAGDIIGWLNADDRYLAGAISAGVAGLSAAPEIECASGGARVVRIEPTGVRALIANYCDDAHKMLTWDVLLYGAPVINARFFRKSLFARIGNFDIRYRTAADREWLIRAKLAAMPVVALDAPVYEYRAHDGSLTLNAGHSNAARIRDEHLEIIKSYLEDGRAFALMRRWHAWEISCKIMSSLAVGDLSLAYSAARQANMIDAVWPARFLRQLPSRIADRLGR
jgi:glycosyltransferase involved in cell wall biosynthesis